MDSLLACIASLAKQARSDYFRLIEIDRIPYMKLQMFGTVGRATVPAETGRHGGRPYDSTRPKFLFRFDWTLAARGGAHMKLQMSMVLINNVVAGFIP